MTLSTAQGDRLIPSCVYCGRPLPPRYRNQRSEGHGLACPLHRDLLAVDPFYSEADQWVEAE